MNGSLMRRAAILVVLFSFFALTPFIACGGGSSAPDPIPDPDPIPAVLTVLDVFPKNLSARTGSSIRFIAETSAQASSFAWDFGSGATPSTSTDFQPLVVLGDPGTYTGALTVCAADCAMPFAFTYIIEPASPTGHQLQILSVAPSGIAGPRATEVQFGAQIAGEADAWEWDFGTGSLQRFSTDARPFVVLYREGIHQGQVTARLSGGAEDSLSFAFQVTRGSVQAAPVIDAIPLDEIWACDNKNLVFDPALISDFPITSWNWTFEGGVNVGISTNSIARVLSTAPGTYRGELRVTNQFGAASPREFGYTIVDCPDRTATVVASKFVPRGIVAIETESFGTVGRSLIDFEPPVFSQHTASPVFGMTRPGPGNVEVSFAASSKLAKWAVGDTAHVSVDLQYPGPAPVWQRAHLVADYEFQEASGIGVLGDRPMIGYFRNDTDIPVISIAKHANPTGPADWTTIHLNEADFSGLPEFHLSAGDGRPVMLITSVKHNVWTATTGNPQQPADFAHFAVNRPTNWSQWSKPRQVGGRFILAATHTSGTGLVIQQSTTVHPLGPADFTTVELLMDNPLAASTWSIGDWQGNPVLLLRPGEADTMTIVASRVPIPLVDADFAIYDFPATNRREDEQPGGYLFGGTARLWLFIPFDYFGEAMLNFSTDVAWPQAPSDWTAHGEFNGAPELGGLLSELDGRLVWVDPEFDPPLHELRRALAPVPTSSQDWFFAATEQADASDGFLAQNTGSKSVVAGDRLFALYRSSKNGTALLLDSTNLTW